MNQEITIHIRKEYRAENDGKTMADVKGGLAIHVCPEDTRKRAFRYTLTHIATGRQVVNGTRKELKAMRDWFLANDPDWITAPTKTSVHNLATKRLETVLCAVQTYGCAVTLELLGKIEANQDAEALIDLCQCAYGKRSSQATAVGLELNRTWLGVEK